MSFSDKVVLVTGAGSGIGAATAIAFAKEGAKVVMVDKDNTRLKNVAEKCTIYPHNPLTICCDVTVESDVKKMMETIIKTHTKLDVLANCAGICYFTNIFQENLMQMYDAMMNVNLRGIIYLTQLAVPHLIASKGNIVNISSGIVSMPKSNFLCYGLTKAALNYFSIDLARELGPRGVRVNSVSPGPVKTNIMEHMGNGSWWDQMKPLTSLGRISEPEEIANVVLFISKSEGIHGSNYVYDNGFAIPN